MCAHLYWWIDDRTQNLQPNGCHSEHLGGCTAGCSGSIVQSKRIFLDS